MMPRRTPLTHLAALTLLVLLAACQPSPAAPAATAPAAAPGAPTADGPGAADPSPGQRSPGGPGGFNLEDPSAGLDGLASYRQAVTLAFDGAVGGQETHAKTTLRRTVTGQPQSLVTWLTIDDLPEQMYGRLGEVSYQQTGPDGPCVAANLADGEAPPAFQLQTLPVIRGAEAAGEETVNGIPSTRYTFDERALGLAGGVTASGAIWVASEGGYVVQYMLKIEGKADQLGPGVAGVQTWEYHLTDPNAVGAPDLPATCGDWQTQAQPPIPPEAVNVIRQPGFVEFDAPLSVDQVAAFYQGQAEAFGWIETDSNVVADGESVQNFRGKEGGLVSIRIAPQPDGTKTTLQTLPKPAE